MNVNVRAYCNVETQRTAAAVVDTRRGLRKSALLNNSSSTASQSSSYSGRSGAQYPNGGRGALIRPYVPALIEPTIESPTPKPLRHDGKVKVAFQLDINFSA